MRIKRPGFVFSRTYRFCPTTAWLIVTAVLTILASQIATAQSFTVLYTFTGVPDGGNPSAGLLRTSAGTLYGTTQNGGDSSCGDTTGCGVVFKVDTSGKETLLHVFHKSPDGKYPASVLVRDAKGTLYGTTTEGGRGGWGTVFKVDKTGKEAVLFAFRNGNDGGDPQAGLLLDAAGNLYGTTAYGGKFGFGTVFMLSPGGKETVLYSFKQSDAQRPYAGLIRDAAGNLYGTTVNGGARYGSVFKIGQGKETVLYSFGGGADGAYPYGGLVRDSKGNLFGTTSKGGSNNVGTVFQVDKKGHQRVLYSFTGGSDGGNLYDSLVRDPQGNLYGTARQGGHFGFGVVFKIDTAGKETVLYSFSNGSDGEFPISALIRDSKAALYGTAPSGGNSRAGTIFKITP